MENPEPTAPSMAGAVGILGTGSYVPERILDNDELATIIGKPASWIAERTGVLQRRVVAPAEATSDLSVNAGRRAMERAGVGPDEIDLIIVATSTPDQPMPATACTVQAALGIRGAAALDVDAVCTGFVYALHVAHSMLRADPALRYALVVGADVYSRVLDYTDPRTASLFGDGAGAVVIGPTSVGPGITYGHLGADGNMRDYVQIQGGGSRYPASALTVDQGMHYFRMRGREVRGFVEEAFPALLKQTLDETNRQLTDIDLIVPHQANVRLLADCAQAAGVAPDQMAISGDRFGNTGAASVPLALDTAVSAGRVRPGDDVLLLAFGGGMTWGTVLCHWEEQP